MLDVFVPVATDSVNRWATMLKKERNDRKPSSFVNGATLLFLFAQEDATEYSIGLFVRKVFPILPAGIVRGE